MRPLPAASALLVEHLERVGQAAHLGPVLDVACGRGRHCLEAARAGFRVVGMDRSEESLRELRERAALAGLALSTVRTDLEPAAGIPVRPGSCGAILVFRFLFRELAPAIVASLAPGGVLVYETFTVGQAELPYGPNNPDFLLGAGELPSLFGNLDVEFFWEGDTDAERPEALARLVASRPVH